jgi:Na+/proline symporter
LRKVEQLDQLKISHFPFVAAIVLAVGSLILYFLGALVSRVSRPDGGENRNTFNLDVPDAGHPEELFAISLVSAATTLSTIFIFFLVNAPIYGIRLFLSPLFFAVGTLFAVWTYRRLASRGYTSGDLGSGLLPEFVLQFTGSRLVSLMVLVASIVPVLSILVLELICGSALIERLLSVVLAKDYSTQVICLIFLASLLGYVFIGGFRAVIASDVWQYRLMSIAAGVCCVVLILKVLTVGVPYDHLLPRLSAGSVSAFYVDVAVINLLGPVALATSWQRFYAFQKHNIDYVKASRSAALKAFLLWGAIITFGILYGAIDLTGSQDSAENTTIISAAGSFIDIIFSFATRSDIWLSSFVFPLLIIACCSGMYSCADTCVSSLIYLKESFWPSARFARRQRRQLGLSDYITMTLIFVIAFVISKVVIVNPGMFGNLVSIALGVFGNVILLSPAVAIMSVLPPAPSPKLTTPRCMAISISVLGGVLTHWGTYFMGDRSHAVILGLAVATIPVLCLYFYEIRLEKESSRVELTKGSHEDALSKQLKDEVTGL